MLKSIVHGYVGLCSRHSYMMTDLKISKRPILFVAVLMIIGVLLGQFIDGLCQLNTLVLILVLLLSNVFIKNGKSRLVIAALAILFFGVYLSIQSKMETISYEDFKDVRDTPVKVLSVKQKKDKLLLTGSIQLGKKKSNVLIHVRDSLNFTPEPGMIIRLQSTLYEPGGARIPGGFDYQKYLNKQGVQLISYSSGDKVSLLSHAGQNLNLWSWRLNQVMMDKIDKIFSNSESSPLVKGILLGFKEDMDAEKRTLYSTAGIGHVFAVSGMHVGMVYLFCFPLLFFRNMGYGSKLFIPLFILMVVWLFIMASGMTPSAVRAGTMISLFEMGKMFYRRIDKWNILAFTAILAICFNSRVIHDIGFQFSYLALIGIFFFYSKFSSGFVSKNLLIKWSYNAIVLSVAAQLTLLPLSLYYFGNFSPYFWLSSLFAMFVVQVNFVLSFIALMMPADGIILAFSIDVIDYLFFFLHDLIQCIMKFPAAALSCKLDLRQVTICYLVLMFIMMIWSSARKLNTIKCCMTISMLVIGADVACGFIPVEPQMMMYQAERVSMRLQNGRTYIDYSLEDLIEAGKAPMMANRSVAIMNNETVSCPDNTNILVLKDDGVHFDFLDELSDLTHIIIAGKMRWKTTTWLQQYCLEHGIQYHNLNNGLIKINL